MGKAIDIDVDGQAYTMFVSYNNLSSGVVDFTAMGESVVATIGCNISLMPKVATYNDYKIAFAFDKNDNGEWQYMDTPLNDFTICKQTNKRSVPYQQAHIVGTRNLSASTGWGFSFWNLNTPLAEKITNVMLDDEFATNTPFVLKIGYHGQEFAYCVVFEKIEQKLINNQYISTTVLLTRHSYKEGA